MQENETGGMYFESPKQAVEVISDLLSKGDWKTLSRYYDLSGTETSRRDLESGRFFLGEQKPEASHPGGFWRHRHPFAPGFGYHFHHDEGEDIVVVSLRIEIDQGAGMIQEGRTIFKMRKSAPGVPGPSGITLRVIFRTLQKQMAQQAAVGPEPGTP